MNLAGFQLGKATLSLVLVPALWDLGFKFSNFGTAVLLIQPLGKSLVIKVSYYGPATGRDGTAELRAA